MRRKPAILLFLLVLLLSIGGAVFQHHLDQKRLDFRELDSYLRNEIAPSDWVFSSTNAPPAYDIVKPAWWNKIGIRPTSHCQRNDYYYHHRLSAGYTLISIWREDGKLVEVAYAGGVISDGFKKALLNRFPVLNDPPFNP